MTDKVRQKNILAGRDVIGRDRIENHYYKKKTSLSKLFQKLEYAKEHNLKVKEIIEDLKYYSANIPDEKIIGLENKLEAGKRIDFLDYALKAKEFYARKLYKNEFFEAEQEINVFLLALVENYFQDLIYPLIKKGISDKDLKTAIHESIIVPLLNELEDDTLGFYGIDIAGMLYFLTGKCHIKWE